MRLSLSIRVGIAALLGIALVVPSSFSQQPTKPVKVDAKCPKQVGGKFSISVHPLEVVVVQGDAVEWKLFTDNSKNEDIKISAKNPEDWLYSESSKERKKNVVMTQMKETSPGDVYEYSITVYCGDKEPVILDPRVKVGGG